MKNEIIITAVAVVWAILLAAMIASGYRIDQIEAKNAHLCRQIERKEAQLEAHRDTMEVFRWWVEANEGDWDRVYSNLKRLKRQE